METYYPSSETYIFLNINKTKLVQVKKNSKKTTNINERKNNNKKIKENMSTLEN